MTDHFERFQATWKIATLAGLLSASVLAAPYMAQAQGVLAFSDLDRNVDGVVSEDEFLTLVPGANEETYRSADINGDSVLTQEEYEALASTVQ